MPALRKASQRSSPLSRANSPKTNRVSNEGSSHAAGGIGDKVPDPLGKPVHLHLAGRRFPVVEASELPWMPLEALSAEVDPELPSATFSEKSLSSTHSESLPPGTTAMAAMTTSHVDPVHSSVSEEQLSSSDSRDTTAPADSDQPSDLPKEKMRDFEWGGGLVRKTLPAGVIPTWLDPLHVDVDDPRRLPLCWFGVPFVEELFFGFARRVGLAAYYTRPNLPLKPGDLDTFQTWENIEVWFKKRSGLRLDLHNVWGEPDPILTFWSNHQLLRITDEMWGQACDLLDGMEYGEGYEMLWYLDRSLDY